MLQTICNDIGKIMLEGCANAGRMMLLFTDTLKRVSKADWKETVRQMAKLGADSLPIVMMTILFTGMVFSVQTAKEFVRFGASSSVGGIVAIAMGRELVPVLTGVVVAGRIGAAIAAEIGTMKVTEQIDALKVMVRHGDILGAQADGQGHALALTHGAAGHRRLFVDITGRIVAVVFLLPGHADLAGSHLLGGLGFLLGHADVIVQGVLRSRMIIRSG